MKTIVIRTGDQHLMVAVRETEDPATWELEWAGVAEGQHPRLMLKTAENIVLRNGGERIVLTCGAEQKAMVAELGRRPDPTVFREGARFAIQLIAPAEDGRIHDDDDFHTPLRRITCPTCVGRIAKGRTRRREDAFGKRGGAKGNSRAQPADRRSLRPAGGDRGSTGRPTEFRNSPEMTFTQRMQAHG